MKHTIAQPPDIPSSFSALLSSSHSIQVMMAGIASRYDRSAVCGQAGSTPLDYAAWESELVYALGAWLADLVSPNWVAALLPEPSACKLYVRSLAGLPPPAVSDFPLTPDLQNQLAETARGKENIFWWDSSVAGDSPIFSLADTRAICAIPFFGDTDRVEILLAMGLQHPVRKEHSDWHELLRAAGGHLREALSTYRRIVRGAPAVHIETNCSGSNSLWGSGFATSPTALATIGVQPRNECGCNPSIKDYCAVATLETGCTRLLAARLTSSGMMRLWECAACDGIFRAACALHASPAETVEWISSIWAAGDETNRLMRLICCLDVADSGREYVFSGTGTHLLYENGSQTVNEAYERLPDCGSESRPWTGQHSRLHSGDILILHTFNLPALLCHRHDVLRRLAMLLAREGRRPISEIVPKVVSLLSSGGNDNAASESSLMMLRAE